jgi:hypothetical protein
MPTTKPVLGFGFESDLSVLMEDKSPVSMCIGGQFQTLWNDMAVVDTLYCYSFY